jgi:hypothetical protein
MLVNFDNWKTCYVLRNGCLFGGLTILLVSLLNAECLQYLGSQKTGLHWFNLPMEEIAQIENCATCLVKLKIMMLAGFSRKSCGFMSSKLPSLIDEKFDFVLNEVYNPTF